MVRAFIVKGKNRSKNCHLDLVQMTWWLRLSCKTSEKSTLFCVKVLVKNRRTNTLMPNKSHKKRLCVCVKASRLNERVSAHLSQPQRGSGHCRVYTDQSPDGTTLAGSSSAEEKKISDMKSYSKSHILTSFIQYFFLIPLFTGQMRICHLSRQTSQFR